jgi:membrane protein YdbS with pleckstrin-like domain
MPDKLFENSAIGLDQLPMIEHMDFVPVERKYANVLYLSTTFFYLIILVGLAVLILVQLGLFFWLSYVLLLVWLALYLFSLWFVGVSVRHKSYLLRYHDISYREGVFFKTWITIPFSRVQHCEIIKGVINGMVGLVELRIFTAGGSSSDIVIPGLQPDVAFSLKEHIIGEINRHDEEE